MQGGGDGADAERARDPHEVPAGGKDPVDPPGRRGEGKDGGRYLPDGVGEVGGRAVALLRCRDILPFRAARFSSRRLAHHVSWERVPNAWIFCRSVTTRNRAG